mmetsp:Transcript_35193/g.74920  ORF Transcript_35193/g.74920 Transcript_35193/m.74920 type:complete len:212 (+) Transcript_35193:31-666(+)
MERTDVAAARIIAKFPEETVRVGLFGSTILHHEQSQQLGELVGKRLAERFGEKLVLVTGANADAHKVVAKAFFDEVHSPNHVFHLTPASYQCPFDFGTVLQAGSDMAERRAVLAKCCGIAISVEGGPGTMDEIQQAHANGAVVLPLARVGGASQEWHKHNAPPFSLSTLQCLEAWKSLANESLPLESTAEAVVFLVSQVVSLPATEAVAGC